MAHEIFDKYCNKLRWQYPNASVTYLVPAFYHDHFVPLLEPPAGKSVPSALSQPIGIDASAARLFALSFYQNQCDRCLTQPQHVRCSRRILTNQTEVLCEPPQHVWYLKRDNPAKPSFHEAKTLNVNTPMHQVLFDDNRQWDDF